MKTVCRLCVLIAVVAAVPAYAGELQLTIADGRATLIAQDVPVRQILAEWARLGGTKIINGEKLAGPPVSLQIVDKPEREVLEVVLRSASGYVTSPRSGAGGASVFETVMIMPTSRPPAVTASAPPAFNQRAGFQQPQPQPQPVMPVDDNDAEARDQATVPPPGALPPGAVNTMPGQPGVQPQVQPYPGIMQQPGIVGQPGTAQQPGMIQQPGQAPLVSPRPGMLPQPQQVPGNPYQPPPQPNRRPGGTTGNQGV